MINCHKCGKPAFSFGKKIYIIDKNSNYHIVEMHGCERCKIVFAYIDGAVIESDKKEDTSDKIDKAQKIFGDISKRCNSVLGNIK